MKQHFFSGVCTAMVTPFTDTGEVDFPALKRLLLLQTENAISTLVLLGTTGEPCTLSFEERESVLKFARRTLPYAKIVVGVGSNDTAKALTHVKQAVDCGADGLLAVTPYYNKCTQEGLLNYYRALGMSGLPLIAYNVPSRTGTDLLPKTAQILQKDGCICAVKEASGNMGRVAELLSLDVPVFSGDDVTNLSAYALGAVGCISVLSNLLPAETKEVFDCYETGDVQRAAVLNRKLFPITKALFSEVNPIPVKYALSCKKLCQNVLRPPLTPIEKPHATALVREMVRLRVL